MLSGDQNLSLWTMFADWEGDLKETEEWEEEEELFKVLSTGILQSKPARVL